MKKSPWITRFENLAKNNRMSNAERMFNDIGMLINGEPPEDVLLALATALVGTVILLAENQSERVEGVDMLHKTMLAQVRNYGR
jgi:hypothetical protein